MVPMDNSKVILVDVLQLLPFVEERLLGKHGNLSDTLELMNIRQSIQMLESMIKRCGTAVNAEELSGIIKRIRVAKDTVEHLYTRSSVRRNESLYRDELLLSSDTSRPELEVIDYGRPVNMTNDEFDALIDEWAEDRDSATAGARLRKKRDTGSDEAQEQIRSDLVKLADTMKSKALWYRDILVKDNEALSKYTEQQGKQLDTVAQVAAEASKLVKTTKLTLKQSLFMIATSFALIVFTLLIFIIT
uniref:Uncharacterized protein n=1 Tax=Babesia bovis TaxID=5865 RepID=S6BLS5_BABBO|nr:hypothetical protein [Babesia bovis]